MTRTKSVSTSRTSETAKNNEVKYRKLNLLVLKQLRVQTIQADIIALLVKVTASGSDIASQKAS
jgi:hypothetical protein